MCVLLDPRRNVAVHHNLAEIVLSVVEEDEGEKKQEQEREQSNVCTPWNLHTSMFEGQFQTKGKG